MSTPSSDGWSSPQQEEFAGADAGQPYGQPFDPLASSPQQQPPPPEWEQGTWTHHGGLTPSADNGRWVLVGIGVLVILIAAAVVVVMLA